MGHIETARRIVGRVMFSKQPVTPTFAKIGVIVETAAKVDAITLKDGDLYFLENGMDAKRYPAGARVTIIYEIRDGRPVATSVRLLAH
jgi:Protein of unknown function (DUF1344)